MPNSIVDRMRTFVTSLRPKPVKHATAPAIQALIMPPAVPLANVPVAPPPRPVVPKPTPDDRYALVELADGSWTLRAPFDRDFNNVARANGFMFDKARELWIAPRVADPHGLTAQLSAALSNAERRAMLTMRTCEQVARALSNMRVSPGDQRLHLRLPPNAPTQLHQQLGALGAKFVTAKQRPYYSLPLNEHTTPAKLIDMLKPLDMAIPPPPAKHALLPLETPHHGIAMDTDGSRLFLRCADSKGLDRLVVDLQAYVTHVPERVLAVRQDLYSTVEISRALDKLAASYQRMALPPYNPYSGVDVPASARTLPPDDPSLAATGAAILRHFGGAPPAAWRDHVTMKDVRPELAALIISIGSQAHQQRIRQIDAWLEAPKLRPS